jgi:hypothetical protein
MSEGGESAVRVYSWLSRDALPVSSGTPVAVEAGVTDTALDALLRKEPPGAPCPVVRLSSAEVRQQIMLLSDGLLGTGKQRLGSVVAMKYHGLFDTCRC